MTSGSRVPVTSISIRLFLATRDHPPLDCTDFPVDHHSIQKSCPTVIERRKNNLALFQNTEFIQVWDMCRVIDAKSFPRPLSDSTGDDNRLFDVCPT